MKEAMDSSADMSKQTRARCNECKILKAKIANALSILEGIDGWTDMRIMDVMNILRESISTAPKD